MGTHTQKQAVFGRAVRDKGEIPENKEDIRSILR